MRTSDRGLSCVPPLLVWSMIVGSLWCRSMLADEVLTLTGDNPNVGFIDTVAPTKNWQILANDLGFRVRDVTSGVLEPFFIFPGAPDDSLVVNTNGEVGLGVVPNGSLHIRSFANNTSVLIEGNQGDIWRILAGTGGFTIDELSSIKPFTLQPGSPDNALFVASNGSVGIGTDLPNNTGAVAGVGKFFNVRADGNSAATGVCNGVFQGTFGAQNHLVHLNAPTNQRIMRLQCSSGFFGFHVLNDTVTTKAVSDVISIKMSNGNVGLRVQNPAHPLQLASGAHVTAGGVFTNASSRIVKQDIHSITSEQARDTVRALQPVEYRYKNEPDESYVGFIAEDVPELVATKDRKSLAPMDVVAVLTKVVQDQDKQIADQNRRFVEERRRNDQERLRNDRLEAAVNRLTQRLTELEAKLE